MQDFFCLWQLCPRESWAWKWHSCWACRDPDGTVCRDTDCLCHRSYGSIRVFFRASGSWWSEGLLGQSFSIALPIQALRGLPCLGSYFVVQSVRQMVGQGWGSCLGSYLVDLHIRHLKGHLGGGPFCSSLCQAFDGPAFLLFSCRRWCVGREILWWWLHSLRVTQQYHLASMAAQLSSTGISHHSLLLHIPSIRLSAVYSSPCPVIAPQSLNSSS